MRNNVASGKMLLSDRHKSLSEERHDEPKKHVSTGSTTERELLEVLRPRYLKVNKVEKQKMLDEFTSATGYHRKHAIRVLKTKDKFKTILKGKPNLTEPSMKAKWYGCWSRSGRSMGVSVPNGYSHFWRKASKCWNAARNRSFKRHERTIAKNQFCQPRSLLTPCCSHQVVTWLEYHHIIRKGRLIEFIKFIRA